MKREKEFTEKEYREVIKEMHKRMRTMSKILARCVTKLGSGNNVYAHELEEAIQIVTILLNEGYASARKNSVLEQYNEIINECLR